MSPSSSFPGDDFRADFVQSLGADQRGRTGPAFDRIAGSFDGLKGVDAEAIA